MYDKSKILFATVGTGKTDAPNEEYKRLLRKAIGETNAENVCLFPSKRSLATANEIKAEYDNDGKRIVSIEYMGETGMEFNADKCYEFFENVFQKYFSKGFEPENFVIDFTHGTKAMSAALYAIGMRYRVSDFHYIVRNNNDKGEIVDGETVRIYDASYARELAVLDQCKLLFKTWQFEAVETLLNAEKPSKKLKTVFERVKMLARFYSAWDRMDYAAAVKEFPMFDLSGFEKFIPSDDVKNWLDRLARPVAETGDSDVPLTKTQMSDNAEKLGDLLVDLYANTLRRIETGLLEDGGIRIYRIAEMLGQACLFRKGYVSDQMPANDENVKFFARNNGISTKKCGDLFLFGREKVAEFLLTRATAEGDAEHNIAKFLVEKNEDIRGLRNTSVLIHGFSAKAKSSDEMRTLLNCLLGLVRLLIGSDKTIAKLHTAMFMNNFKDNA